MYRYENWIIKRLNAKELMLSNYGAKEDSWESLGPQGNQQRNQLWIVIGRTDAEAEALVLWPCDAKSQLTGKDSDAGKDWGQEEKRATEDEKIGWHHWFNGCEFEQTPGNSERQGNLAWCSSMSSSNSCFLTHIQVSQETGKVIWYSHLFKNYPQFVVMHMVKGF